MKISAIKRLFHKELDAYYGAEEVDNIFFMALEHHVEMTKVKMLLQPEYVLTDFQHENMVAVLKDLKDKKPIQYVLGETEFYGLTFNLNSSVLIPRQETEELVHWIMDTVKERDSESPIRILDIGTGSGCIAISLAKNLQGAQLIAVDVFTDPLGVAKANAELHQVKVEFVNLDILDKDVRNNYFQDYSLDIIVSNPPYVGASEKTHMKSHVLDYEPHSALFVDDVDDLLFYKQIIDFSKIKLKPGGYLFFEINQYLAKDTMQLFEAEDFHPVILKKDLNGNDRMIKAIKR